MSNYTLDDKTIGQIAKCVQVAILTGTDVVDHLRQLQLTINENTNNITCTEEYLSTFDQNINKMITEAAEKQAAENDAEGGDYDQLSLF